MPGVQTSRRGLMSDHATCARPAYRPSVSGSRRIDHPIVRVWRKGVHTRCMPLILRVASLTPWGLVVGRCWLELKIDCVVICYCRQFACVYMCVVGDVVEHTTHDNNNE